MVVVIAAVLRLLAQRQMGTRAVLGTDGAEVSRLNIHMVAHDTL